MRLSVLLLYKEIIPSVRLCIYEQLLFLSERGLIDFQSYRIGEINKYKLNNCDIVISVRGDSLYEYKLLDLLKKSGKHIIYVLDDDLLNVPPHINCYKYYNLEFIKSNIQNIIQISDILLSPSKRILQKYNTLAKDNGLIEQPALHTQEFNKLNEKIRIGFAGSIDRTKDIDELLTKVIHELICKYGDNISIEFFGAKPKVVEDYNLTYYPYEDCYEKYNETMRSLDWDIGIAPLIDNEFNSCKHYNKFIEYCSYGIIGVYSKVDPYKDIVQEGINGFLCKNTVDSWVATLSFCIENRHILEEIRKNELSICKEQYTLEKSSEIIFGYLRNLKKVARGSKIKGVCIVKLGIIYIINRLYVSIKLNGIGFIGAGIRKMAKIIKYKIFR